MVSSVGMSSAFSEQFFPSSLKELQQGEVTGPTEEELKVGMGCEA